MQAQEVSRKEKEVNDKFFEIRIALKKGKYIERMPDTVKSIMDNHIKEQEKNNKLKPNSMVRKKRTAKLISEMSIANKPIQKVTADEIKKDLLKFVDLKGKYNYSQSYIDKIYSLLRETFNQAVIDEKINLEDNPFKIKR